MLNAIGRATSKTFVLPLILGLIAFNQLLHAQIDRCDSFNLVSASNACLGRAKNPAETRRRAQHSASDGRSTRLFDQITGQRGRKAGHTIKGSVNTRIFIRGYLVWQNSGDSARANRLHELGDAPRRCGHQFTAGLLPATMHQPIQLFKRQRFIEGNQISDGGEVHPQELPISQMRSQNDDTATFSQRMLQTLKPVKLDHALGSFPRLVP